MGGYIPRRFDLWCIRWGIPNTLSQSSCLHPSLGQMSNHWEYALSVEKIQHVNILYTFIYNINVHLQSVGENPDTWRLDDYFPWVIFRVYAKLCGYKIWKQSSQFVLKNNLKTSQIICIRERTWLKWSAFVCPPSFLRVVLVDMKWASDWKDRTQFKQCLMSLIMSSYKYMYYRYDIIDTIYSKEV